MSKDYLAELEWFEETRRQKNFGYLAHFIRPNQKQNRIVSDDFIGNWISDDIWLVAYDSVKARASAFKLWKPSMILDFPLDILEYSVNEDRLSFLKKTTKKIDYMEITRQIVGGM